MGVPFRCNRFHVYGHVISNCSLSFSRLHNNTSFSNSKSYWRVKNVGFPVGVNSFVVDTPENPSASPRDVLGVDLGMGSGDESFALESLKPLCLSAICEEAPKSLINSLLGSGNIVIPSGIYKATNSFLGDLGFVSPIKDKHVSGVGYYLRSGSKPFKEPLHVIDSDRFSSRISCPGSGGLVSDKELVGCGVPGALRAVHALSEVPF